MEEVGLVPEMATFAFLPETRPKDLPTASRPVIAPWPTLVSRSEGNVPLPRLLNAARSRSLPLPYFNNEKTIVGISVLCEGKGNRGGGPFRDKGEDNADTYETGTNGIDRVAQAVTCVRCSQFRFLGREEAHRVERKEWNRRLATFVDGGIRTPEGCGKREL